MVKHQSKYRNLILDSHPVWSFCAQLLAKAQDIVNENNKKQIVVVVDGLIGGKKDRAIQKKVTVKPKPEVVIVISPEERKVTVNPKPEVVIEITPEAKADKSRHSQTG
ncbi:hypothetical protein FRX31_013163 [Thalictrum thalictroides]|uniref:Uncharacterized protein n=1 Tax=Thalictrum thalictroides TaxID=46969 RepID=A0A7J6WIR4_THATH|nr:hypothetical protein FRX31_013163 [Thalictrum thalictroides]